MLKYVAWYMYIIMCTSCVERVEAELVKKVEYVMHNEIQTLFS